MFEFFLSSLLILSILIVVYMIKNSSIWDSILGMGLFGTVIIISIVLYAVLVDNTMFLDIAIAFSLLSFVGSIFTAIFIYKKGGM